MYSCSCTHCVHAFIREELWRVKEWKVTIRKSFRSDETFHPLATNTHTYTYTCMKGWVRWGYLYQRSASAVFGRFGARRSPLLSDDVVRPYENNERVWKRFPLSSFPHFHVFAPPTCYESEAMQEGESYRLQHLSNNAHNKLSACWANNATRFIIQQLSRSWTSSGYIPDVSWMCPESFRLLEMGWNWKKVNKSYL